MSFELGYGQRNWWVVHFGNHWQDLIPYFDWLQANAGTEWMSYTDWPVPGRQTLLAVG